MARSTRAGVGTYVKTMEVQGCMPGVWPSQSPQAQMPEEWKRTNTLITPEPNSGLPSCIHGRLTAARCGEREEVIHAKPIPRYGPIP